MKNTKRVLSVLMAMLLTVSIAACSTKEKKVETKEKSESTSSEVRVGVILKTLASEYWGYVEAGAKAAGEELGVSVDVVGAASETAFDEQLGMIETSVGSGDYDVLSIAPLQPDMAASQVDAATIPILAVDTDIPSDNIRTFIGTGNEDAAYEGGKYAAEQLIKEGKEKPQGVCISGVQGDLTAEARLTGYKKGFEEAGGKILEVQYADAVADKAVAVMEGFLEKYEQIDAVLCNNDDMAMAASKAAKDAGREGISFVGFDGISSACQAIIDGDETFSVAQDPYQMGYLAVKLAVDAYHGEELKDFTDTGISMITPENAKERLDTMNKLLGK